MNNPTATLGIFAVLIFGVTLVVIANLTPEFHFLEDYVSVLGAQGQPYAVWWNLIGFPWWECCLQRLAIPMAGCE